MLGADVLRLGQPSADLGPDLGAGRGPVSRPMALPPVDWTLASGRLGLRAVAAALLLAAVLAVGTGADEPRPPSRPLVGAIRWDAWTDWDLYANTLAPPEWYYRLPFYARVLGEGKVEVRCDRGEVMDQEITYAREAGLDYWAWVWYDPWHEEATELHMNACLDIYRASPLRADINYCLIGGSYWSTRHWEDTVACLVAMFREPNYQKVLGNRPLFYYFMAEVTVAHFGAAERARAAMDELRSECVKAGLGPAYIVGLCFWPDKGARAVDEVGFDAMGSYCNPGGADGKELPYEQLAGLNRWFWEECRRTGKPFVPPVNSGWDYRPLIGEQFPDRDPRGNWYTHATPSELAAHLKAALSWTRANSSVCQADTVLVYAWNEFAEGGWICPTLSEGAARLEAIGSVLNDRGP